MIAIRINGGILSGCYGNLIETNESGEMVVLVKSEDFINTWRGILATYLSDDADLTRAADQAQKLAELQREQLPEWAVVTKTMCLQGWVPCVMATSKESFYFC